MAYPHCLSTDLVKRGQSILDDKDLSIGEVKDNFLEFLEAQNLLLKGVLHTDVLLTHPKDLGSLLLIPNNAHRNGSLIRRVGANISELHNAVSMEMSPDPVRRQELRIVVVFVDNIIASVRKNKSVMLHQ